MACLPEWRCYPMPDNTDHRKTAAIERVEELALADLEDGTNPDPAGIDLLPLLLGIDREVGT